LQPVPSHEGGDRAGRDAEQRGQFLLRVPLLRRVERRQRRGLPEHAGEEVLNGARGDVGEDAKAAAVKDLLDAGGGVGNVLGVVALGGQVPAVVVDVLGERPAGVLFPPGVGQPAAGQLGFLHQLAQHHLGGGSVFRERHAAGDAVGVAILAVPLGGQQTDAVALTGQGAVTVRPSSSVKRTLACPCA